MSVIVGLSPIFNGVQFYDNNGDLLSGGKIFTYQAGTLVNQTTYTSVTGLTANANPLVLDSSGRLTTEIWLDITLSYKFVVTLSDGSTILMTLDNIYTPIFQALPSPLPVGNGGTGQITASAAINALLPSQTGNSGDFLKTNGTVASWSAVSSTAVLSSITAATTTNTIDNGNNAQVWDWALTSSTVTGFAFGENTHSTGGGAGQVLVTIGTLASSTATPLVVLAQGNPIFSSNNLGAVLLQTPDVSSPTTLTIRGGNNTTGNSGGSIVVIGGSSGSGVGGGGNGGSISLTGGAGLNNTNLNAADGGTINLTGGTASSTGGGAGGAINITGGIAGYNTGGGVVTITGGLGGPSQADGLSQGGPVQIIGGAGDAAHNNYGGYVAISQGQGHGSSPQGNIYIGNNTKLVTTATNGFIFIQATNGQPSANPITTIDSGFSGTVPMTYDTVNNKLWVYNSGWKSVTLS